MTASIPTQPWSPAPLAYSEVTPADDDLPLSSPRHYGNGPVVAALVGAGLACAALGLVAVENLDTTAQHTVAVAPGAVSGPAAAFGPGIGADSVAPAGEAVQPAPLPDPAPLVAAAPVAAPAAGPAAAPLAGPAVVAPNTPPPPPDPAPADGPAPADPGSPPPAPSGPVVVVNVPVLPPVHIPPPVWKPLPPPPPPVVKPVPPPSIPLPIVKLPPPPAPAPTVCLPPHHLVAGHCQ
jgi:hypothetical protein